MKTFFLGDIHMGSKKDVQLTLKKWKKYNKCGVKGCNEMPMGFSVFKEGMVELCLKHMGL